MNAEATSNVDTLPLAARMACALQNGTSARLGRCSTATSAARLVRTATYADMTSIDTPGGADRSCAASRRKAPSSAR